MLNIQDIAARQFRSPFEDVTTGLGADVFYPTTPSMGMPYSVTAYEKYTGWTAGVPSTVLLNKPPHSILLTGFRTANMIHPYHKNVGGVTVMDWTDDLKRFPMFQLATDKEFLTWGSRTKQKVKPTESFFLSVLWDTGVFDDGYDFLLTTYDGAGNVTNTVPVEMQADRGYAASFNVGPAALTGLIPAGTAYYTVQLSNNTDKDVSELFRLNMDYGCSEVCRRVYWQNKLGGIDQFSFTGREADSTDVERELVERQYVPTDSKTGFNRRMYRTRPERLHVLTSDLIGVETLGWLAEDLFESADVRLQVHTVPSGKNPWWTPVILKNKTSIGSNTNNVNQRMLIEYSLGVDNMSQHG